MGVDLKKININIHIVFTQYLSAQLKPHPLYLLKPPQLFWLLLPTKPGETLKLLNNLR